MTYIEEILKNYSERACKLGLSSNVNHASCLIRLKMFPEAAGIVAYIRASVQNQESIDTVRTYE